MYQPLHWIIPIAILFLVVVAAGAFFMYQQLTASVDIVVQGAARG
jgi:uncharacterized protein YpmB